MKAKSDLELTVTFALGMDDQRCTLAASANLPTKNGAEAKSNSASLAKNQKPDKGGAKDDLLNVIAGVQGQRMNEQRAAMNFLPGLTKSKQPEILQRLSVATKDNQSVPDDSFFEMLMKCQGTRIEDQRSSLPQGEGNAGSGAGGVVQHAPTVPDEDFFSLIQRIQGGRLEDQRASLPANKK